MQRAKYTPEFKEEAVRQVIDKGHPVVDVAKRLGIGDQILYKWVKKFKDTNQPVAIDDMKSMQAELNRLKAELRRTTEERDILKRPPRTLPNSQSEVRVYPGASLAVHSQWYVPGAGRPPQWLLCLAAGALVAKGRGEPSSDSADQRVL